MNEAASVRQSDAAAAPVLRISRLRCGYGAAMVVHGVDLEIGAGEVLALLGKNGMGKSTLLKAVMGFLPLQSGEIGLFSEDVTGLPPHLLARRAIAYSPQEQALFQDLTVEENLKLVVRDRQVLRRGVERVGAYFTFIPHRLRQRAGTLSGGEQKMLLVARALLGRPRLMLIDEISEGLQPSVIGRLASVLRAERAETGCSILLVEQNVGFALSVADRFAVLQSGEIVEKGAVGDETASQRILLRLSV
jgi:ABC-type branched-subunit amino acid transport system ATPase component